MTLVGAPGVGKTRLSAPDRSWACWTRSRTASGWSSWRRWPIRTSCRRPSRMCSACASSQAARCSATLAELPPHPPTAAGAGQLRAPGRRLRRAGRDAAAAPARACASSPPAASRWPSTGEVTLPGAVAAVPASIAGRQSRAAARRAARLAESEAVRLFVERARRPLPGVRADRAERRARRADLRAPGRHPAGDRAGGRPRRGRCRWSRSPRAWTTASAC